jgi:putative ABC transport system ATP-binding protein
MLNHEMPQQPRPPFPLHPLRSEDRRRNAGITVQRERRMQQLEQPLIQVKGLEKTYTTGPTEVRALRGIDLAIQRGEFVAIMGPSGSGKTTMMEVLGCLSRPSAGTYWLNGRAVHEIPAADLAVLRGEQIGFVFQSFNLLPRLDALENVELPLGYRGVARNERRARAREALRRVGLEHRSHHRPAQMSGGERQRVAIARALVNRPSLVLADEPTGNLDSATGHEIMELLRKVHGEGNTVVIVTHDPAIGQQTERRVMIHDGLLASDSAWAARS